MSRTSCRVAARVDHGHGREQRKTAAAPAGAADEVIQAGSGTTRVPARPSTAASNEPGSVIDAKLELADDQLLVAVDGEAVVGSVMAGYDGHRGWLYAVAVDPQRRRRGLGRRLVEAALARLAERGCVKVNLQVRSGNDAVVGFYRELGFDMEPRISLGKLLTESANGAENP